MNTRSQHKVGSGTHRSHSVWLVLSLLFNLVLGWALYRGDMRTPSGLGIPQRPLRSELVTGAGRERTTGTKMALTHSTDPWISLGMGDYAGAVALLRAAHCPEETIQDLLALQMSRDALRGLEERSAERRRGDAWWRSYPRTLALADRRDELDARARLKREFEQLFGTPYLGATAEFFPWRQTSDPSPIQPEHQADYDALKSRHLAERDAIYEQGAFGSLLDGRLEVAMSALQERQRMEVEQLLTPGELEALSLRDSEPARVAKKYLPEAQTEDQFRVMVRVAKELGLREEIPPLANESDEQWSARMNELISGYRYRVGRILGEVVLGQLDRGEEERRVRLEEREKKREGESREPRP